jgi:hypothetical protein
MNKFGVDELAARSILQIDGIYIDTKHQYFIGEEFQGAKNVREYFAMQ